MSDIKIHDYSARARTRIARLKQIEALPPQPARHQGDHWDFTRRGFAHGFFPGRYGERTGRVDPIVAAAREAALEAGIDISLVDDIDIGDLIVTPEFISGNVGGISFRTSITRQPTQQATLSTNYEILNSGHIAVASIAQAGYSAPAGTVLEARANFPSIVWLESLHVSATMTNGSDAVVSVEIDGLGNVFTSQLDNLGETPIGPVNIPLRFITEHTGGLTLRFELKSVAIGDTFSALALLTWKNVRPGG